MDDGSDSSLWHRLTRIFHSSPIDTVEQAIRDASEEGELDKEEGSMLLSVLTLDDLQVQDIMTPRTDIACASDEESIGQVAELIIATGHSRIPIYSGNRDNIIGILHAKDLLEHMLDPEEQDRPASSIMRDPFFVPETKNVLDLLQEFRHRKVHLAVILDEYGGTAGLVTIEDVLEEIVGEIEDEHDAPREEEISPQADGSYLVAGRTYLDDLTEKLNIAISSDEVDTLGGYLTHLAGRVPEENDSFTIENAVFTIVASDAKQVHSIRVSKPGEATLATSEAVDNADMPPDASTPDNGNAKDSLFDTEGDAALSVPSPVALSLPQEEDHIHPAAVFDAGVMPPPDTLAPPQSKA